MHYVIEDIDTYRMRLDTAVNFSSARAINHTEWGGCNGLAFLVA